MGKAASQEPKYERYPALRGPYLGQRPPSTKPEVFAPGIISSTNINHSAPAFSLDGNEVYWSRVLEDPPRVRILYMQQVEGHWTKPGLAPFSSNADDDCPVFSPDGRRLYFVSHRPAEDSGLDGKENIWYVEKEGPGWKDVKPVSSVVNKMNLHWQVSVSSDYTLYFSASQDKTTRIYRSRLVDSSYAEPKALPYPINSGSGEETPWVAPDESYIIFSSQRKGGLGGADLYISFRNKQKDWLEPVNLGPKVNSRSYELLPYVSPDQKYLFFVSARGGEYDVYWVESKIIEQLREQLDVASNY
ncbi:MAG: PD40 domain-containing protein [Phycisphaerales bacterium]|nr:MAG: PD40 domain-containing protein [Phycisphaerales bacterium]